MFLRYFVSLQYYLNVNYKNQCNAILLFKAFQWKVLFSPPALNTSLSIEHCQLLPFVGKILLPKQRRLSLSIRESLQGSSQRLPIHRLTAAQLEDAKVWVGTGFESIFNDLHQDDSTGHRLLKLKDANEKVSTELLIMISFLDGWARVKMLSVMHYYRSSDMT